MSGERAVTAKALMANALARPIVRHFFRFAAVGAAATAVHYAILIALVELAGLGPTLATSIGFCFGLAVSYALNRRFTFKDRAPVAFGFARFAAVAFVGLAINAALVASFVAAAAPYLAAQALATVIVLFWNFAGARLLVFRGAAP